MSRKKLIPVAINFLLTPSCHCFTIRHMDIEHANQLIKEYKVRRYKIAKHMGLDPTYLGRYLSGAIRIPPERLSALYDAIFLEYKVRLAQEKVREELVNG